MQNRHLDSEHIVFAPPQGDRNPGIHPKHHKVLVLTDQVVETTEGGIALPESSIEKADLAQTEGELISVGGDAFHDWSDPPDVGQRVAFAKWSGQKVKGEDGLDYRFLNDNDILGVR